MKNLNEKEFLILREIEKKEIIDVDNLLNIIKMPTEDFKKIMVNLKQKGLIDLSNITDLGIKSLEPYRVKRAIFLAAGFGERMLPITLNTPKPLIFVHGKRIIETLLDAVIANGIEEIIIVRGYLKENFDVLLNKYPNIKFIDNLKYSEENNPSSVNLIKDKLSNAYVFESDLYLTKPDLINKYEYECSYTAKYVEKTDDWCFDTKNGYITGFGLGGYNCYHTYGISYFDKEAGEKYAKDFDYVYNNILGSRKRIWDFIQLDYCKNNYQFKIKECQEGDIIEIDSFSELQEFDKAYAGVREKVK